MSQAALLDMVHQGSGERRGPVPSLKGGVTGRIFPEFEKGGKQGHKLVGSRAGALAGTAAVLHQRRKMVRDA